jgi:hypothetical protein
MKLPLFRIIAFRWLGDRPGSSPGRSIPPTPLKKQGVFKVGGKLQNDFFKTLFHTAIAPFFRNFGLINIKNQPKH